MRELTPLDRGAHLARDRDQCVAAHGVSAVRGLSRAASYPIEHGNGPFVLNAAGVEGARGLEQHDLYLLVCHGPMLDTARYDDEVAGAERDDAIAELHAKGAAMHEKHLVFGLVMMPHEGTLELRGLHLLAIEVRENLRTPMASERRELLGEIDLLDAARWRRGWHGTLYSI